MRECQARRCQYSFGETLADVPTPLALTHWDDHQVIIALPPLTCDPRIIKVRLPEVSVTDGIGQILACEDERAILTLCEPIYFPTSTPRRRARLMYRGDKSVRARAEDSGNYLYLALDTLCSADIRAVTDDASATVVDGVGEAESPHPPGRVSPPVVLRWKIAQGEDGWRPWKPDEDELASDLKRPVPIGKLLQGQFVDPDKRFSVSIRGGLDWTRKGFLSCATF